MGEVKQEITNEVNTDAGCFGDDRIGLGGVMHDSMGEVMPATYTTMRGSGSVDVVEALTARHYLKIALDAELDMIKVLSDNISIFACI